MMPQYALVGVLCWLEIWTNQTLKATTASWNRALTQCL